MNIFDSYIEAGQKLSTKERKDYYCALIEYVAYGKEPENLKGAADAIWTAIFPSLEVSRQRSKSGSNGGKKKQANQEFATKQNEDLLASKSEANGVANGVAKSNSKSNSKETTPKGVVKKTPHFSPPTVEEVKAYADSLDRDTSNFDAERFCDFYASKGWKVGSSPMKDWKAAARNWVARDNPAPKPKTEKEVKLDEVFAEYGAYYDAKVIPYDELEQRLADGSLA